jgi:UDP-N-acetylmuramate--alanine ligase
LGEIKLNIPGIHNVYNALSAIAVSKILGLDISNVISALEKFRGFKEGYNLKVLSIIY